MLYGAQTAPRSLVRGVPAHSLRVLCQMSRSRISTYPSQYQKASLLQNFRILRALLHMKNPRLLQRASRASLSVAMRLKHPRIRQIRITRCRRAHRRQPRSIPSSRRHWAVLLDCRYLQRLFHQRFSERAASRSSRLNVLKELSIRLTISHAAPTSCVSTQSIGALQIGLIHTKTSRRFRLMRRSGSFSRPSRGDNPVYTMSAHS